MSFADEPLDFIIDHFRCSVAVVSFISREGKLEKAPCHRFAVGQMPETFAHTEPGDHLPCKFRRALQVIRCPCGNFAVKCDFLRSAAPSITVNWSRNSERVIKNRSSVGSCRVCPSAPTDLGIIDTRCTRAAYPTDRATNAWPASW